MKSDCNRAMIERVIRQEMTKFLDTNHQIEDTQHGSRSGWGNMPQLLRHHDMLIDMLAKGKNVDFMYLQILKPRNRETVPYMNRFGTV